MESFNIMKEFDIHYNKRYLDIAESLTPVLYSERVFPEKIVSVTQIEKQEKIINQSNTRMSEYEMKKDDSICVDFGEHLTGYVSLKLSAVGSHQDAPAYIRLKFGEIADEIKDSSEVYDGWLSRGWIQEEFLHIDVLPAKIELPRRYAFRYMEIKVIDTSRKFRLVIDEVSVERVSAVQSKDVSVLKTGDLLLDQIDRISINTLKECMQLVFEDGPKRDRRMWLGDLRLQARANYETFRNYDLVKRCLYLFCGLTFNKGQIAACLFTKPEPEPDDTYLMDYALFLVPTLLDYYEATKDMETLKELYPIAMEQIDNCISELDENKVVIDKGEEFWCFIDWGKGLNKQAGAQAILIYCMRYGIRLAKFMSDKKRMIYLNEQLEECKKATIRTFWDENKKMFTSGKNKQISWATQIWMILARIFDRETNRELIYRTIKENPEIQMVTPYMYHHYIDALIRCGEETLALEEIKKYWGGMVADGADTFWELYNPCNKNESPYGSSTVNSYCHAWSCTPTYFLRKFFAHIYEWTQEEESDE